MYRIGHKLAQRILNTCKANETPIKEVVFDYNGTQGKVSTLNEFIGKSGWFQLQHLAINSFEQEDYLLMACYTDNGETIHSEVAQRFFSLNAIENDIVEI